MTDVASLSPRAAPPTAADQEISLARCLCGAIERSRPYPSRLPWVTHCAACGMRYTEPQPSDAELAQIYGPEYYATFGYKPGQNGPYQLMKQARFHRLLACAEQHVETGRLLDVGSALGDLLLVAQERNWRPLGIERNAHAVEIAEGVAPGATLCCEIEDLSPEKNVFDLVTCIDVIEHLRRPEVFLDRSFQLLRPGGMLLVTTIDSASALARVLGSRWVHYHRDHLWYFTRNSLSKIAEQAGFDVVCCQRAKKVFNLDYVLEILAATPNSTVLQETAKLLRRWLPAMVRKKLFTLPEGLMLLAHRP